MEPATALPQIQLCSRAKRGCLEAGVLYVLRPGVNQLFHIAGIERTRTAELPGGKHNFSKVLNCLHFHISAAQGLTISDNTMVRHENGVMVRDEGTQGIAEFGSAGGGIRSKRNFAQCYDDLRAQRLIEG